MQRPTMEESSQPSVGRLLSRREEWAELLPPRQYNGDYMQAQGAMRDWKPSGVHDYRRVVLENLFPELMGITLADWYRVPRVACCAFLRLDEEGELYNCERCGNRGYVCPICLGARFVVLPLKGRMDQRNRLRGCGACCQEPEPLRKGEKPRIRGDYSPGLERMAVAEFLRLHYPEGVARLVDKTHGPGTDA